MLGWFFESETSRTILSTLLASFVSILTAIIAAKNVSRTIRNQNKGLPPEILRVEKIQSVLINHLNHKKLNKIDMEILESEYRGSLKKLFLESRLASVGVVDEFSRQKLLKLSDNIQNIRKFPDLNTVHGSIFDKFNRIFGAASIILGIFTLGITLLLLVLQVFILVFDANLERFDFGYVPFIVIYGLVTVFLFKLSKLIVERWGELDLITDLIVRNVYQYHTEYFTGMADVVRESELEARKRLKFENSKKYKKWIKENPGKTSWDYGFENKLSYKIFSPSEALPMGYHVEYKKIGFITSSPFLISNKKVLRESK
ncbi:hypothetical protein GCM10007359_03620 [Rothia aerolata]|uniref:Uncharacterized protein n=2 Tax=Rothia aerolata TaxID=1812262 RepID=A0A917INJ8_9MICC|nr:hypothetical protein GCM10007359_03620 [Rothia aerolata]